MSRLTHRVGSPRRSDTSAIRRQNGNAWCTLEVTLMTHSGPGHLLLAQRWFSEERWHQTPN